jgi:hypothetical protein
MTVTCMHGGEPVVVECRCFDDNWRTAHIGGVLKETMEELFPLLKQADDPEDVLIIGLDLLRKAKGKPITIDGLVYRPWNETS